VPFTSDLSLALRIVTSTDLPAAHFLNFSNKQVSRLEDELKKLRGKFGNLEHENFKRNLELSARPGCFSFFKQILQNVTLFLISDETSFVLNGDISIKGSNNNVVFCRKVDLSNNLVFCGTSLTNDSRSLRAITD
jgi:hypothetical protein